MNQHYRMVARTAAADKWHNHKHKRKENVVGLIFRSLSEFIQWLWVLHAHTHTQFAAKAITVWTFGIAYIMTWQLDVDMGQIHNNPNDEGKNMSAFSRRTIKKAKSTSASIHINSANNCKLCHILKMRWNKKSDHMWPAVADIISYVNKNEWRTDWQPTSARTHTFTSFVRLRSHSAVVILPLFTLDLLYVCMYSV